MMMTGRPACPIAIAKYSRGEEAASLTGGRQPPVDIAVQGDTTGVRARMPPAAMGPAPTGPRRVRLRPR